MGEWGTLSEMMATGFLDNMIVWTTPGLAGVWVLLLVLRRVRVTVVHVVVGWRRVDVARGMAWFVCGWRWGIIGWVVGWVWGMGINCCGAGRWRREVVGLREEARVVGVGC